MAADDDKRKLVAILSADVVGYSRMMGADESGTLAALKTHRNELVDPKIAEHNGRIVKLMGDGLLAEFASAVDAVRCAVAIQRAMAERNTEVPEDRRFLFRVGVNVGDVIIEGDDIYGDGVNVAARLQEIAEPGEIHISRTARDHVRDKLDIPLEDLGERAVKNIARPVRVFRVVTDGASGRAPQRRRPPPGGQQRRAMLVAAAISAAILLAVLGWQRPWSPELQPASVARMAFPLPDKPSIAVLPFANLSGDPEQEYFADGITEDIITALSRFAGIFVISRNSVYTYKGKPAKVQRVSEELGVRYVLEGTVQRAGDRVRVHAQLIDATKGHHLWAERIDSAESDVFALQDEVTQKIVAALAVEVTAAEAERVKRKDTVKFTAYDYVLRGQDANHFVHRFRLSFRSPDIWLWGRV